MTERARGVLLMSLVLSVTLGPAWTADSSSSPDTTVTAVVTPEDTEGHAPQVTLYGPYAPYASFQHEKRAQLGFHGMRGKKNYEPTYAYNPYMQEWAKRASLGFQGMRGKKWYDYEDAVKRASMGFQGMRGKKDDITEEKRLAQGFHGMRGKKDDILEDFSDNDLDKRASSGFLGMRGKKLLPDEPYELIPVLDEVNLDEVKRAMSGFHGMRGKKADEVAEFEMNKRATMGFHGMRGKKDDMEDADFIHSEADKRAMGFHGMRGKKENELSFKRAMGFLGMRGKKDEDWTAEDKRAQNQDGFFGMRGKKSGEGDDLSSLLTYLTETGRAVERTRRAALRNSKKAKSAFFGMRGKKSDLGLETSVD